MVIVLRRITMNVSRIRSMILLGLPLAVWLLLTFVQIAEADNCKQYIERHFIRNLKDIPQELVEDCMRTGYIQAILTALAGGIGGPLIARAVGQQLARGTQPSDARPDDPPHIAEARRRRQRCWEEARSYRLGGPDIGPGLKDLNDELKQGKRRQLANMWKFMFRAGMQIGSQVIDAVTSARLARAKLLGAADEVAQAMARARQLGGAMAKAENAAAWVARTRAALQAANTDVSRLTKALSDVDSLTKAAKGLEEANAAATEAASKAGQAFREIGRREGAIDGIREAAEQASQASMRPAQRAFVEARNKWADLRMAFDEAVGEAKDLLKPQLKQAEEAMEAAEGLLDAAREAGKKAVNRKVSEAASAVEEARKAHSQLITAQRIAKKQLEAAERTWYRAARSGVNAADLARYQEELEAATKTAAWNQRQLDAALSAQKAADAEVELLKKAVEEGVQGAERAAGIQKAGKVATAASAGAPPGKLGDVGADPLDVSIRYTKDAKGQILTGVYTLHGNYDDPAIIADGMQYINMLKQRIKWLEGRLEKALQCVRENEQIIRAHDAKARAGTPRAARAP